MEKELDYLVSVVKKADASKYIISVLDLNTGDIVESLLKQYDEDTFKQNIESIAIDTYENSKIIFENENMWLTNFLKENFEKKLYKAENPIFGRKCYGWRPSKSIFNDFRKNTPEIDMLRISINSLFYFFDKSRGML